MVANAIVRERHDFLNPGTSGHGERLVFVFDYMIHDEDGVLYERDLLEATIGCRVTLAELVLALQVAHVDNLVMYYLDELDLGQSSVHIYTFRAAGPLDAWLNE